MTKQEALVHLTAAVMKIYRSTSTTCVDDAEAIYNEIATRCITEEQKQSIVQPVDKSILAYEHSQAKEYINALEQEIKELTYVIEANKMVRDVTHELADGTILAKEEFRVK